MQKQSIITILALLFLLGIATSAYLLKLHYSPGQSSFCNISPSLNCDAVNQSKYSLFPPIIGIPVAFLGLLNFLILLLAVLLLQRGKTFFIFKEKIDMLVLTEFLYYALFSNLFFALYLIYIEAFILNTFCILCLLLDAIIIISLMLAYKLRKSLISHS
ncbi:MAG TPA: vitamin K epoxide reductase family protein [Candidatus Nanoarchaeia archaeon]|nr:vitamin K epoxide reductase family protein [Candidatus Nanoarchaeia archaeon]